MKKAVARRARVVMTFEIMVELLAKLPRRLDRINVLAAVRHWNEDVDAALSRPRR